MEHCPNCNKRLRKDPNNCPRCGWKRKKIFSLFSLFKKAEKPEPTGFCPGCGKYFYHNEDYCSNCEWRVRKDRISFWLILLSLLIPGFGHTYWEYTQVRTPRRAAACRVASYFLPVIYIFVLIVVILCLSLT